MKYSDMRTDYIAQYLASYKEMIKLKNKAGLFDCAKLYELFASVVCKLWFGKDFINLNTYNPNYRYVDLISDDSEIYVQVTTQYDIPAKIQETLQNICKEIEAPFTEIRNLYFFVLDNNSIRNVRDYSCTDRIGKIDFKKEEHLITHERILARAKYDFDFQTGLYQFLKKEEACYSDLESKLQEKIQESKLWLDKNINTKINNEYEISRESIISKIRNDNNRFVCIQGGAGSGKSAICKLLIKNEELILCARAEKITEINSIDAIWDIDINKALNYLNGKKIFFLIDALEFIADSRQTKMDLLQTLFDVICKYDNAYLLASFRTFDYSKFQNLISRYDAAVYKTPELSEAELLQLAQSYPVISQVCKQQIYAPMLRIPFYLDMIVKRVNSLENIKDINDLRTYIWRKVLCMEDDDLPQEIPASMIRSAIYSIAFTRARTFCSGVSGSSLDSRVLRLLLSKNIITETEENYYRLSNDIFEDICFEQRIDEDFFACKENYNTFFETVGNYGRCIFRRYQIWIENKLFAKNNRNRFLLSLLIQNNMPDNWETETIIGIVRSLYCEEFFSEYENIISDSKLSEFIHITNLHAFSLHFRSIGNTVLSYLSPVGKGRNCLLQLIYDHSIYQNEMNKTSIVHLCSDYSKSETKDEKSTKAACLILEYYIDQFMKEKSNLRRDIATNTINSYLDPLYWMAEKAKEWIVSFWQDTIINYRQIGYGHLSTSKGIIEYVLKSTCPPLAKNMAQELCDLANAYWVSISSEDQESTWSYDSGRLREYGLNSNAAHYHFDFQSVSDNSFIWVTAYQQPFVFLKWLITLTNHAAKTYASICQNEVTEIEIWFEDSKTAKRYIGIPDFWLAGVEQYYVNDLIGDCIYAYKSTICQYISSFRDNKELALKMANTVKELIYSQSNNIMMLTIIAEIGFRFRDFSPGYAMDLASSFDLIEWDFQRFALLSPNETIKDLEKTIFQSIGLPSLKKRYSHDKHSMICLRDYFFEAQVCFPGAVRHKAANILDYLFETVNKDGSEARKLLIIQQMDYRTSEVKEINDQVLQISPNISGKAKKYLDECRKRDPFKSQSLEEKVHQVLPEFASNGLSGNKCVERIDQLVNGIADSQIGFAHQKTLVILISYAFTRADLTPEARSHLCNIWIYGIKDLLQNKNFLYDHELTFFLFKQVENKISSSVRYELEELMLDLIMYRGGNGRIDSITKSLKQYLSSNQSLAKKLFYTVFMLSMDHNEHYKYNLSYLSNDKNQTRKCQEKNNYTNWSDSVIRKRGGTLYKNNKERIIMKYLFNGEPLPDIENIDLEMCDLSSLCYIVNCGLGMASPEFDVIFQKLIDKMLSLWSGHSSDEIDPDARYTVVVFLQSRLQLAKESDRVIELLFDYRSWDHFSLHAKKFYIDIFACLAVFYFDAKENRKLRDHYQHIIRLLEERINVIPDPTVRIILSETLLLSTNSFLHIDGNNFPAYYSALDKHFLNELWAKHGKDHIEGLFNMVYHFHIKELLPDILPSVARSLKQYCEDGNRLEQIIGSPHIEVFVRQFITVAYTECCDQIKQVEKYAYAYEEILELLCTAKYQIAAVLLGDFRIH